MSIFIENFKYGMDWRRARVAGAPGTLWLGRNVHITRGGDIERTKAFVPIYDLPAAQTYGLAAIKGQLYTFGSVAEPVDLPVGVQYQRLQDPDGNFMSEVLDARPAGGKMYVIARYQNGNIYHFYDGVRVSDWDAVAAANSDITTVAEYLADRINVSTEVVAVAYGSSLTIKAKTAGTAFTISKATTNAPAGVTDQDVVLTTVQANVAAVTEVRATGTVTILTGGSGSVSSVKVNAVEMMAAAAAWVSTASATANAVAAQINSRSSTHGYTAAAVSGVVTLTAPPGSGDTVNTHAVSVSTTGTVNATTSPVLGGVTAVEAVAQIVKAALVGTYEANDSFQITINGTTYISTGVASGMGTALLVHKKRVYCPAGSLWEYSQLNDFDDFSDASASSGAGFINVSNDAEGAERLVGAAPYQDQVAIFSRRNIRLYDISTDAQENTISRSIDNSGALSARSIRSFGNIDLFYLDETGVRSLRAHEQNAQAFVNDIGTAIDPFVRAYLDALPGYLISRAVSAIEPREGRFWMAVGNRIFVLSYFPQSEISAWTFYEPGFTVSDLVQSYNRLYIRAGDTIYLYGGETGIEYPDADELLPEVQLPFIATSPPAREKLKSIQIACTNEWHIQAAVDPNNESALIDVGRPYGVTYNQESMNLPGRSSHCALTLTCSKAGAATISNITFDHTESNPKG